MRMRTPPHPLKGALHILQRGLEGSKRRRCWRRWGIVSPSVSIRYHCSSIVGSVGIAYLRAQSCDRHFTVFDDDGVQPANGATATGGLTWASAARERQRIADEIRRRVP